MVKPLMAESGASRRMDGAVSRKVANMAFLCALLVVVIHLENVPEGVGSLAWTVHYFVRYVLAVAAVPYFFLASGYFLARHVDEPGWWGRAIAKRLRTLGIPYLVWCLVPIVVFSVCWPGYSSAGECWLVKPEPGSIAAAFGLNLFTLPEANRPLWYVRALMLLVLVSPALVWLLRKGRQWTLLALLALYWSVNTWSLGSPDWWISVRWRMVWIFGFSLEGLFYFCAGMFLARRPVRVGGRTALWLGLAGLVVGLFGMALEAKGVHAYGYPVLVSIPLVMLLLWRLMPSAQWPAALVGSSFAVYVMHPVVIRAMNASGVLPSGPFLIVVEYVAAVAVTVLLAVALHRALPRVSSVAFGGR